VLAERWESSNERWRGEGEPTRLSGAFAASRHCAGIVPAAANSEWRDTHFKLDRHSRPPAEITGVRLFASDQEAPGGSREREVQTDLSELVQAVSKLRTAPGWESVVLSDEHARGRQPGIDGGMRVRFGLAKDKAGEVNNERAAKGCYRQITRAINRCGFCVVDPPGFDPKTGMSGLEQWGTTVRLQRHWRPPGWVWLLPLLLLLALLRWFPTAPDFIGPVPSDFIVILDRSSSMRAAFPEVIRETKRLISTKKGHFADIIFFAENAESAWGQMRQLTDETISELDQRLDSLQVTGGTKTRPSRNSASTSS
jgi:hypothetical protein